MASLRLVEPAYEALFFPSGGAAPETGHRRECGRGRGAAALRPAHLTVLGCAGPSASGWLPGRGRFGPLAPNSESSGASPLLVRSRTHPLGEPGGGICRPGWGLLTSCCSFSGSCWRRGSRLMPLCRRSRSSESGPTSTMRSSGSDCDTIYGASPRHISGSPGTVPRGHRRTRTRPQGSGTRNSPGRGPPPVAVGPRKP